MLKRIWIAALPSLWLVVTPGALQAQQKAPSPESKQNLNTTSPLFWGVDQIMDTYLQQMTRYYNLTKEQEEYTRGLMGKRVKEFLKDYEKDVRWLAAEMFDYQMKKEMPPAEIAKEWGARGKPLLSAIRQQVFDGNNEWRSVLNEDQRRQHDKDLQLMKREFDQLEEKFDRWSSGEVRPNDFPGTVSSQPRAVRRSEDAWMYFVRYFIQMYNLDEGQKQTAYSILRELREEATKYREAHKEEYAKLDSAEAAVAQSAPKTNAEELKELRESNRKMMERRRELDRPISEDMFNRLKRQLEAIPTNDQRRARERHLAKMNEIGRPSATQPAGSASQPAAADASKQIEVR